MLQYVFLLMSDHFWQMSEQILSCADMCLSTFQALFHTLSEHSICMVVSNCTWRSIFVPFNQCIGD